METAELKPNIEVKNLNLVYNQGKSNEIRALQNINLTIYPREYVIIFGPSGCGKSTLLYTIAGFQKPTEGEVVVDGQDVNKFNRREKVDYHRRKIGMVFQSFFLISTLKIFDNICLPKVFVGASDRERQDSVEGLLERFGIREQAGKFPAELSGGQKQRVAIARALVNNPDIIIADEPVGNLDSKSAFNVMSILSELNEKDKKTIILVTHDPTHLSYGSKVIHMQDGRVVKTEEVVERKRIVLKGEEEILVKRETVDPEIQMLMRSFRGFTPSQLGMLLIPFKAQEFMSHILFDVPEDQMRVAREKLQEVISGRSKIEDFEKLLDEDEQKGGLNWDKRVVRRMIGRIRDIISISEKINLAKLDESAKIVSDYLVDFLKPHLLPEQRIKLTELVKMRLENNLSIVEFRKGLDRPTRDRGMGLDKRTARKIAQELEVLLLARFST